VAGGGCKPGEDILFSMIEERTWGSFAVCCRRVRSFTDGIRDYTELLRRYLDAR
jgi:hypothetical protein